jgi:hypothetical protein
MRQWPRNVSTGCYGYGFPNYSYMCSNNGVEQSNRNGRRNLLDGGRRGTVRPRSTARTRTASGGGAARENAEARLGSLRRQARDLAVHIDSLTNAYEHAAEDGVIRHLEYLIRLKGQRLDALTSQAAELDRTLSASGAAAPRGAGSRAPAGARQRPARYLADEAPNGRDAGDNGEPAPDDPREGAGESGTGPAERETAERTEQLISHGRPTSFRRMTRRRKRAVTAGVAGTLAAIAVAILAAGGASWPASVATVQNESGQACQNPNLESEPGQVNFACAKDTRQVLWVLALLTSDDNPRFADTRTHRLGLEPIQPAEGGEIAWSLNLHHPYNPDNPIDSLAVAARAINNIIGGATVTGANGSAVVQQGLESKPANCLRYTGSPAVTSHNGFPGLCAKPVTSPAGQAALVTDVYTQWIVGAPPQAAQDAGVLYENSGNPGDPRVQAILKQMQSADLRA